MNKDAESWARVSASTVTSGSQKQAENVLQMALADIAALTEKNATLYRVLQKHHDWHLQSGTIGLPIEDGSFVEIDNALEYSDSILCAETAAALVS